MGVVIFYILVGITSFYFSSVSIQYINLCPYICGIAQALTALIDDRAHNLRTALFTQSLCECLSYWTWFKGINSSCQSLIRHIYTHNQHSLSRSALATQSSFCEGSGIVWSVENGNKVDDAELMPFEFLDQIIVRELYFRPRHISSDSPPTRILTQTLYDPTNWGVCL